MIHSISQNRLARFLLSYSEADLGISAIIMLVSTIAMTLAFIAFAASQTNLLQQEFINVGFHNPKFFEDIRGIAGLDENLSYLQPTSNYVTYELMRQNIFPVGSILIFAYIMTSAWGEASGIFSRGKTKPMFFKFLGMMILVMVFVPIWDTVSVEVERFSIQMLNPMYSQNTKDNCINDPDRILLLVAEQNREIYERLEQSTLGGNERDVCHPQLRIAYVYQKAFAGATTEIDNNVVGFDRILTDFANIGEIIGSTIFMGMTKTMLLFSLTLTGLIIMTLRELLLGLIISLLPMFVLLAFVPKVGGIFAKLLEAIVPLMLIPIITAAVFLTGAGILLDMEDEFVQARSEGHERFTFWIASISLLILAITIPLLMVPLLSGMAGQASSMVGTAVMSGALSAVSVIKGGATGAAAGIRGVHGSESGFLSRAGMTGVLGGLGHGLGAGASAGMMTDTAIGMGHIAHGAGAVGTPFQQQGNSFMSYAGSGPGGGFDPEASAKRRGDAAAKSVPAVLQENADGTKSDTSPQDNSTKDETGGATKLKQATMPLDKYTHTKS